MKKAVIVSGGVQYLVAEGDDLLVNHIPDAKKSVEYTPIMIVDGKNSVLDAKKLASNKVTAKVTEPTVQGDKVIALRYKAKKRVNTKRGHRQTLTKIKIDKIV